MVTKNPFEHPKTLTFDQLTPVADIFSFANVSGIEHRIDADEREFLRVDPSVVYPRNIPKNDALAQITLEGVSSDPNIFELPKDYISLQHVLNEAVGARGSGDRFAPEEAGPQSVRQALERVGEAVGNLALRGRLVPTQLDYQQIILERSEDKLKPRLLPPMEFVTIPETGALDLFRQLRSSLGTSLFVGATSTEQRNLASIGIDTFYLSAVKTYTGVNK